MIGFTFPFSVASGSIGYFQMTNDVISATKENLRSLLLTSWGERVNHYHFGCNLKEFLFENMSNDELKSRIADRILNQVETWLPFVSVQNLNVFFPSDDTSVLENSMKIRIDFVMSSRPDLVSTFDMIVTQ